MRIMIKEVGRAPYIEERETFSLSDMQELVGGYLECISITDNIDMWINDEGKLLCLPTNMFLASGGHIYDSIQGDVFFASHDGEGETVSLGESDDATIWRMYGHMVMCHDPYTDCSPVDLYPVIELGGDYCD